MYGGRRICNRGAVRGGERQTVESFAVVHEWQERGPVPSHVHKCRHAQNAFSQSSFHFLWQALSFLEVSRDEVEEAQEKR